MGTRTLNLDDFESADAFMAALHSATKNTGTAAKVMPGEFFINHKHRETAFAAIDLGVRLATKEREKPKAEPVSPAVASGEGWGLKRPDKRSRLAPAAQRRLYSMREQEVPWNQIAKEFDCSVMTARRTYERIRKELAGKR